MFPEVHMEERYVGYEGAEKLLGIRRATLYSMVHAKRIPHLRIGRRFVRFEVSALLRWLEGHQVDPIAQR